MRLNRNTLLIFLGAIAVIVAALILINRPQDTTPQAVTDGTSGDLFPEAAPQTVTSLSVTDNRQANAGLNIILERSEGDDVLWQIVDSTDTVDAERVDTAISNLASLTYTERYDVEDASQYGLGADDTPSVITFLADGTEYTLNIGRQNPSGNRYYTRLTGDESVYVVNTDAINTVLDLASQQPIVVPPTPTPVPQLNAPGVVFTAFSAQDIQRFEVTDNASGETLVLVRNDVNEWAVLDDERQVDQSSVNVLLSVFGFVEAVDAIEGADLEALGLADPTYTLQALASSGETYTVRLGNTDPSGTRTYALIDDFETVAVLEADALTSLVNWVENPPYAPEAAPEAPTEESTEAESSE